MSEGNYEYSPGGGGCLSPFGLALAGMALIFMLALAGGDDTTSGNTALSGNEVMSRNQINVMSDVYNTYYDCYGAYSCVTTSTTSTSTQTTNAPVTVEGDRNNVMTSPWGGAMCWDDSLQTYTTSACQGVQP